MDSHSFRPTRNSSGFPWRSALLTVASLACPFGMLKAGDVYKYVDAQGHVVYSDQAPPDPSAAKVSIVDTAGSGADAQVTATETPPALPDNAQPSCPEEGYLWTPGYWAWSAGGYYWVSGVWVQPPQVGVLWTPGWWGYVGTAYVFHRGYWAPHIGYYGGINYGYGYFGTGFAGGRWVGNSFTYNRAVSNVDERAFHNTYNEAFHGPVNRVSFNGGPGGATLAPTAQERAFAAEPRLPPTPLQRQTLMQAARVPVLVPHTFKANPSGAGTDHRTVAAAQKPTVSTTHVAATSRASVAPISAGPRPPVQTLANNNMPRQPVMPHATTPTPTHLSSPKPTHPLH
jgi:Domain of unknown function (DUF4124)/WXXGXW repeat (2 copies)